MSRFLTYRPEIDGLRTIAVLAVVLFHASPGLLPGGFIGVDVFFVISGFLIGTVLLAEFDRTGHIDYVDFWARRTRRLAPAAMLVIVASLAAASMILPGPEMLRASKDAIFAALYLSNWQSLIEAVSYFDEGGAASLFLHFWSLAVEEQFYVYFSLVFVLAGLIGRWVGSPARMVVVLLVLAGIVSFVLNLTVTAYSQPEGYFGTHARLWQLSAGVFVCLAERANIHAARFRGLALWGGCAAILAAAFLYTGDLTYPGASAILPTVGTAVFLWGCATSGQSGQGIVRLLSTPPMTYGGKLSYALYLWHWPVFQLWKAFFDRWQWLDMVGAIGLSVALAAATHVLVENPVRFSAYLRNRPWKSLGIWAASLSVFLVSTMVLERNFENANLYRMADGTIVDLEVVRNTLPKIYAEDCHVEQDAVAYGPCVYGMKDAPVAAFLFGDSHAAHWFPALDLLTKDRGVALYSRTKSACTPLAMPIYNSNFEREYTECAVWREAVLKEIAERKPRYVFIGMSSAHRPLDRETGKASKRADSSAVIAAAEDETVSRILATGAKVILFRDTPWFPVDPLDCLAAQFADPEDSCSWPAEQVFKNPSFPWQAYKDPNVLVADLSGVICPQGVCSAVLNSTITLRDRHHLSVGFSEKLAPELGFVFSTFPLEDQTD